MSEETEKEEPPNTVAAFVCPSDLWGEIIKLLSSQPYDSVANVLNKMSRIPPQEVTVKK